MEKINPESYSLLLKRAFEIHDDGMVVRLEVAEEAVRIAEKYACENSDYNKLFTDGTFWILCQGEHFADWATANHSAISDELWHTGFFAHAHKATVEDIKTLIKYTVKVTLKQ